MSDTRIVMYAMDWCPYCNAARKILNDNGLDFEEIDLGSHPEKRAEMQELSGRSSVPQVFFGDRHIGGYDDLSALERKGPLNELLAGN